MQRRLFRINPYPRSLLSLTCLTSGSTKSNSSSSCLQRVRTSGRDTSPPCPKQSLTLPFVLSSTGNPFMIETLFTQQRFVSSPSFDLLRAMRRVVLTPTLVEEFVSYVRGQIVVHQKKGLKGKRLYHILRIMFELERIVDGGEPLIWMPVRCTMIPLFGLFSAIRRWMERPTRGRMTRLLRAVKSLIDSSSHQLLV